MNEHETVQEKVYRRKTPEMRHVPVGTALEEFVGKEGKGMVGRVPAVQEKKEETP